MKWGSLSEHNRKPPKALLGRSRSRSATTRTNPWRLIPGTGIVGDMAEVTTPRADEAKTAYLNRLRRIEGQVRGLEKMVADDKYCIDILTQVSAVTKALEAFALALLDDHLGSCIKDAV